MKGLLNHCDNSTEHQLLCS